MAPPAPKEWWERIRGRNRSLKGLISARRRFAARVDRLAGKAPVKRQYSVPEIARRIGAPLGQLKRIIRGQDEAPLTLLTRLAKDLEMPLDELKDVVRLAPSHAPGRGSPAHGRDTEDAFRILEEGLITSAKALVQLLRGLQTK